MIKKISISEIRDNVNNQNITRFVFEINSDNYFGTLINGNLVYSNNDKNYKLLDINNVKTVFKRK